MENRHIYAFTAVQIAAVLGLPWFLLSLSRPWNTSRYIGTVLVVVGLSGIVVARYQLGKSFSVKAEAHKLVTSGLYSRIRNPIYMFGMVLITGMILILGRPVGWFVLVAAIVGQTIRARREGRVLETAFGDEYREYRRKTWF
jgi:protein-S-isoprenylcysteine O-methyltransferase Ste14